MPYFKLKTRKDLVAILGSKKEDKPILSCYVSKELADQGTYQANAIIKEIGQYIKGGGGGQQFFATAGGNILRDCQMHCRQPKTFSSFVFKSIGACHSYYHNNTPF